MQKITRTKLKGILIKWLANALHRLTTVGQQRVICPTCRTHGIKSTVREGASWTNAIGYPQSYDENGRPLPRPRPDVTTEYTCSNGHRFEQQR